MTLLNNSNSDINTRNAIIYDSDGSATDAILGAGASNFILGFAELRGLSTDGTRNFITRARVLLNGKFMDGQPNPEIAKEDFQLVFVHELGHFSGLDHSQVNNIISGNSTVDDFAGVPLMFPFFVSAASRPTLVPDDIAAISALYPESSFATSTGRIRGQILFSDGATPAQGFSVVARQVDNPMTPENESRRIAVSSVSGFLFTACAGNPVTTPGDCGSAITTFGSRDPSLSGFYDVPGLPPGSYTVDVEPIHPQFTNGSSVGPIGSLGFQFGPPGTCLMEFLNSVPPESDTDSCTDQTPLTVGPGTVLDTSTDIILNGTKPRFDAWETAALILLQPLWALVEQTSLESLL